MHPGTVHISVDEEGMDLLPKTPAPRKGWARDQKDTKSVKEVKAGIKCIAAYKRQSLDKEFLNATLQPLVTSVATHNHSETYDPSEEEYSSDAANNASSRPPSESTLEVLTTDGGISSLPDPVGETVSKVKKTVGHGKKRGNWRKQVVKPREEDKPTPCKEVMGVKGKMFVKDTKWTPMPMGKG